MPFIESLEEFSARQRCTPITVRNRYLYPNGAQSDGHYHQEPPDDQDQLAVLKHEHAQAKLNGMIERFNEDRTAIEEQIHFHSLGAGPMPEEGWKEHLKKCAAQIEIQRAKVQKLVLLLPSTRIARERHERILEQQQRVATAQQALRDIPSV